MGHITRPPLNQLLAVALPIARQAGAEINRIYAQTVLAKAPQFVTKSDQSPLTSADLAAHHIIEEGLRLVTPDIAVVSEEGQDAHGISREQSTFWLVDPLDGTREFLSGNGEFTVNIALIEQGQPALGVVVVPTTGECFWGGLSFGSFFQSDPDQQPVSLKVTSTRPNPWRVMASRSHLNDSTAALIQRLGPVSLIQAGSSLKFCRMAQGQADIYPRLSPTCEWDTAAAQAVLEGAGGYVFDLNGKRLRYGKSDVLNPSFIACTESYTHIAEFIAPPK
jgi:3'(2'), 5'-bisphosphate nucleotidase